MYAIGCELLEERWKGQTFYLHESCLLRGFRCGRVHLLPAYDEYLIGYKSRHIVLHPDNRHHAHDKSGTFWNVVLQDGEVVGNWTLNRDEVLVKPFQRSILQSKIALDKEVARYQHFLRY